MIANGIIACLILDSRQNNDDGKLILYTIISHLIVWVTSHQHHEQQGAGDADDGQNPAEEEMGTVFLKPILVHAEKQQAGNKEQRQEEGKHRGGEQV